MIDGVVEHKQTQTACFNVHTRVLTLPMWDKASDVVYDLLVGHEVGHAVFILLSVIILHIIKILMKSMLLIFFSVSMIMLQCIQKQRKSR